MRTTVGSSAVIRAHGSRNRHVNAPARSSLTGATGYVGGRLLAALLRRDGHAVRCLVARSRRPRAPARGRRPSCAATSSPATASPTALEGVDVAYYLVHSMGGGAAATSPRATARGRGDVRPRGRAPPACAASSTSAACGRADGPREHLRSRARGRGDPRASRCPPLVYVRAAMVIGAGSASFQILRASRPPAAGDGHPALDRHAHAADRDRRRRRGARRAGRPATTRPPRSQLGRRRRPHLPRDDGACAAARPDAARR